MRLCATAGRDRSIWGNEARIVGLAGELNRRCDPHLPDDEVRDIAKSVARYSEIWKVQGHAPWWLAKQARKGQRSGETRRAANAERDAAIRAARSTGLSIRELATIHRVAPRQVSRILRASPLPP